MSIFKNGLVAIAISFGAATLIGCAAPVTHNTPSGKAETTVGMTPEQVKPILVNLFTNSGFNITKESQFQIAFDHPITNFTTAALLGSRYDTTPNERVTFTLAPIGPDTTRVVGDVSFVTNPGSAFERITPANNNADSGNLQKTLDQLHDQVAAITVDDNRRLGFGLKTGTLEVATLTSGGKAAMAGFQVGDKIIMLNGRSLATLVDLVSVTNAASDGDADYEVMRGSKNVHIHVNFGG